MARTIVDGELLSWEAFANTGRYGYADRALVVFSCQTDPRARPRAYEVAGDKSDAETLVATVPDETLRELLAASEPLD